MSDITQIDSTKLISAKKAERQVPYSRNYITKLAREGKIVALQIDQKWMVDIDSLKNFFAFSQQEQTARKKYLKAIRCHELLIRQQYYKKIATLHTSYAYIHYKVMLQSIAIVLCGTSVGMLLFTSNQYLPPDRMMSMTVVSQIPQTIWSQVLASFGTSSPAIISREWVNTDGAVETTDQLSLRNGIVILPSSTTTTASNISYLFSDNVRVEMVSTTTGLIHSNDFKSDIIVPFVRVPATSSITVSYQSTKHPLP